MSKENESKLLYTITTALAVALLGGVTFGINTFASDQQKLEERTLSLESRFARIETQLETILDRLSSSPCRQDRR